MLILVVYLICVFTVFAVLGLAGWSDVRTLTIPNGYSAWVVAAFIVAYGILYLSDGPEVFGHIFWHLASALVMFAITFLFFALNMLGAGDSKFATACALWISLKYLPIYLFFMTLFGGVLGIVALYIKHKKPFKSPAEGGWIAKVQGGSDKVPYGVAIAAGVFIAFVRAEYLSPAVLASF